MGMVTRLRHRAMVSSRRPAPSLPTNTAWAPGGEIDGGDWGGVPVGHGGVEPVAPLPQQPHSRWGEASAASRTRKAAPMEARSALGDRGSQQSPSRYNLVHAQGLGSAQHRAQVPRVLELLQHQAGAAV